MQEIFHLTYPTGRIPNRDPEKSPHCELSDGSTTYPPRWAERRRGPGFEPISICIALSPLLAAMAGTSQQALRVVHLYRAVIRDLQPYTTNRWMWFAEVSVSSGHLLVGELRFGFFFGFLFFLFVLGVAPCCCFVLLRLFVFVLCALCASSSFRLTPLVLPLLRSQKEKIRARFEANRHLTDPMLIETTLRSGVAECQKWRHPDPYTTPYLFGGSRYMRNPPMPADGSISMAFDFGREAGTWDPRDTPATGHHH